MRKPNKTKFPWTLWQWTESTENLFELNPGDLANFRLIISEVQRG